nr:MAG TPA: hypothetical protein [Caudoviricetes sp.]
MVLTATSSNPSLYGADYLYLWKTLKNRGGRVLMS